MEAIELQLATCRGGAKYFNFFPFDIIGMKGPGWSKVFKFFRPILRNKYLSITYK